MHTKLFPPGGIVAHLEAWDGSALASTRQHWPCSRTPLLPSASLMRRKRKGVGNSYPRFSMCILFYPVYYFHGSLSLQIPPNGGPPRKDDTKMRGKEDKIRRS